MRTCERAAVAVLWAAMLILAPAAANAQVDLVGQWQATYYEDPVDRRGGPLPGEYEGLPLNDAARLHADTWDPSLISVPERQCIPHPPDYGTNFSGARIWKDIDPKTGQLVALHTELAWMMPRRTIWMDGRPRPPQHAPHTWQGFSSGVWEGDMLTVTTTHLKTGYTRRSGVPRSDKAVVREHFIRNDNMLTWITVVNDPVYLTQPYIKSRDFMYDPGLTFPAFPCKVVVEVPREEGSVPHYLPGANPYLKEYAVKHGLPLEATRGGAETLYPEYMVRLRTLPSEKAAPPAPSAAASRPPSRGARNQ